ncbi:MAG: PilZ domain-containing protein [Polyangiaceae bacterium]|nr:PilZ domain-containing protein [Polyangiaceae bacterium]
MNSATDRRAPGVPRIPFDALVELGGALGPSFEARAVNLSEDGMQLRTAYLPEVGQPVKCCFDGGPELSVVAEGEVTWNEQRGQGGEFGIRFTNLDTESAAALGRIVGMGEDGNFAKTPSGRKVRLHIEGLVTPMRARVKSTQGSSLTAYSELGFLQVGKGLDLEDAKSGDRRFAHIDGVSIEMEPDSHVPQLVVALRYDDKDAGVGEASVEAATPDILSPEDIVHVSSSTANELHEHAGEDASIDDHDGFAGDAHAASAAPSAAKTDGDFELSEADRMKSPMARTAAKIAPAIARWAKRTKTTIGLLAARGAAKRGAKSSDLVSPVRRTTAPPPGGGLHTAGRKVVRGEIEGKVAMSEDKPRFKMTRKKMAVAGAAVMATALVAVALHKSAPAPAASTPPESSAVVASATPSASVAPPASVLASAVAPPSMASAMAVNDPLAAQAATLANGNDVSDDLSSTRSAAQRRIKVTPFGNGPVGHGNVMRIKMDGAIEKIQGASQPAGFTVVIPGRKSLEAAGPLAAKDSRIAAIRMANEAGGAELTVTFKDGVPNYQVRGKGDTLELVLAKAGQAGDKAPEANSTTPAKKKHHTRRRHVATQSQ